MPRNLLVVSAFVMMSAQAISAGPPQEIELQPLNHASASLVVVAADGSETAYSPADLEEMTTYTMTTATPWREDPATFEGVLLADILAANGLGLGVSIEVTAENDYSTVIVGDLLSTVDILVATRVNGMPHNRRERGPIQFVIDQDAFNSSDMTEESNLVWMAARIQAHD